MAALTYEHLIRRIYKVGRGLKHNADADIYRKMEHAERFYQMDLENIKNRKPRISNKSMDDLEYEYKVQARKIWGIVSDSIGDGIKSYRHVLSEEDVKALEDCVVEPETITKETIDNAIEKATKIFVAHKIYAP